MIIPNLKYLLTNFLHNLHQSGPENGQFQELQVTNKEKN